jgi:HemY protein
MRNVIWLILLFALAVLAAALVGRNDAVVTLYWAPWRMDLSFNLFILTLLLLCVGVFVMLQTFYTLIGLPRRAREWRIARRDFHAQQALREALALYFGARYSRAHKAAQRALNIQNVTPELQADPEFVTLARLLAAGSMHRLQDRVRRNELLQEALAATPSGGNGRAADEGVRLMAAEWALEDRDAERALELIAELPPGLARRTQALRLKLQAARLARQPLDALRTARLLAKHQGFSQVTAQGILRSLAMEALDTARDADQLQRVWEQLDASERRDAFTAARAALAMARQGRASAARAILQPFWDAPQGRSAEEWQVLADALVHALDGLGTDWLPRLEAAAHAHPTRPELAYALGCALAELALWGKARQQLERCADDPELPPGQRRSAWRRLAEMAERDEDHDRAYHCFRRAARIEA